MAIPNFWIKQNDTSPAITVALADNTGAIVTLRGASVRFHMISRARETKVDADATIVDEDNGQVRYNWQPGDTDTAGLFLAEWEVTYDDSTIETFPNSENYLIKITDDLA